MINISKLSPSARTQLLANLQKMEAAGRDPEKCAALRKQFNELHADEAKRMESFRNFVMAEYVHVYGGR